MAACLDDLSEREKEVLRLITRGHDAKSCAQRLGLSVHTINDRLRTVRRKLDVTSSREAARMLFQAEQPSAHEGPNNLACKSLGDVKASSVPDSVPSAAKPRRAVLWMGGIFIMVSLALAAALFTSALNPNALSSDRPVGDPSTPIETAQLNEWKRAALDWLVLVDASDWAASFAATGTSFQKLNTVANWRDASLLARVPLGQVVERRTQTASFVNAPPRGYVIVEFHADFTARKDAVEKVTLEKEGGKWRVVGYIIE